MNFQFVFPNEGNLFNENWWVPTNREWAPKIMNDHRQFWIAQKSPEGKPWKPLSPEYKKLKTSLFGNSATLRVSGEMQDTAQSYAWGSQVFVKVTKIGLYHQFGTSKMSARPWLGVPKQSISRIPGIAWKYILK
jgi:hypothetical protein